MSALIGCESRRVKRVVEWVVLCCHVSLETRGVVVIGVWVLVRKMIVVDVLVVDGRHAHATLLTLHGGVEVVLDSIVGASGKMLGHLGPLGSDPVVQLEDAQVFFMCEWGFVDYFQNIRCTMVRTNHNGLIDGWRQRCHLCPSLSTYCVGPSG